MCTIKEVSTHYWTDKTDGKTYATVSMTVRMDDGTLKTNEYQCPTPVEAWEECPITQDSWRRYRTPTPPVNKPQTTTTPLGVPPKNHWIIVVQRIVVVQKSILLEEDNKKCATCISHMTK